MARIRFGVFDHIEPLPGGADYMVLSFQWGSLSHAQAMRSTRLFKQELVPRHGLADPHTFETPAARATA